LAGLACGVGMPWATGLPASAPATRPLRKKKWISVGRRRAAFYCTLTFAHCDGGRREAESELDTSADVQGRGPPSVGRPHSGQISDCLPLRSYPHLTHRSCRFRYHIRAHRFPHTQTPGMTTATTTIEKGIKMLVCSAGPSIAHLPGAAAISSKLRQWRRISIPASATRT